MTEPQPPQQDPSAWPAPSPVPPQPGPAFPPPPAAFPPPPPAAFPPPPAGTYPPPPATAYPQQAYPPPAYQLGAPPAPPVAAPKKSRKGPIIGIIVVAVVAMMAVCVGVAIWAFARSAATDPSNAVAGECLAGTSAQELNPDDLKRVDCADPSATFKIIQMFTEKTQAEADADGGAICTDERTEFYFWSGIEGRKGTVLCLASI